MTGGEYNIYGVHSEALTQSYSYDADGRVTGKIAEDKVYRYALDEHGNLLEAICSDSTGYCYEWICINVPEGAAE